MVSFFGTSGNTLFAVQSHTPLSNKAIESINWLFTATYISSSQIAGHYVGPRKEMISPWSTNAVEILQNMGVSEVIRVEAFNKVPDATALHDKMLEHLYNGLDQELFIISLSPEPIRSINDVRAYNQKEGLALSEAEIEYLEKLAQKLGRSLTDSEVFGFSQINSEHCRHKIFNGRFVIDGVEQDLSLFKLIKKTSEANPNTIVSAYKDNVSFTLGPVAEQFAPATQHQADFFATKMFNSVLSLKAETHNFPTTVEPFNGAATGSGGEIRDRFAGGKGSMPLAGTAVYMTAYPRLEPGKNHETKVPERRWLYQTPADILIKASNGASDFGNKFGQPLINGSLLTFEHQENGKTQAYDKVIMQAGGIGMGVLESAQKDTPHPGDKIVVIGGDNYRIGMGGSAVSSVNTGELSSAVELNAIQRSNPEMQKRAYNAVRALVESSNNPIISIHDHGAGGHLNCLSELVESTGGRLDLRKLPVGDPTLSAREILGNESQERMGLVIKAEDLPLLEAICRRERAPMYVVGDITGDMQFTFVDTETGEKPIDLKLEDMFGNVPKLIITDSTVPVNYAPLHYKEAEIENYLKAVLQLEAVASKDWLTNKVDRSVTGRVAKQQNAGPLQLPLNNLGISATDYRGKNGILVATGHAPLPALIDPEKGSRLAIAEALTNAVWAPMPEGIKSLSLSANWMWPSKNAGEDARLYCAVKAVSDYACALGINIPTGKDSLSMVQKYKNGAVAAPGTVIITASAAVSNIRQTVEPVIVPAQNSELLLISLWSGELALGGSSLAQVLGAVGHEAPDAAKPEEFVKTFNAIQQLIKNNQLYAGHDVSAGGLITALLEMTFAQQELGLQINLDEINETDIVKVLFAENPALIVQAAAGTGASLKALGISVYNIGKTVPGAKVSVTKGSFSMQLSVADMRQLWAKTSWLLDRRQTLPSKADERYAHLAAQPLVYKFPVDFSGTLQQMGLHPDRKPSGIKAAIIREKGVNGDREMAYSMYLAGFDVKDVHMTDLISGREDLSDVHFIVFVGGFSNSDVAGSAKGWAGAFLFNEPARKALDNFYARPDTLSLGVCNGCQLVMELGLIDKTKGPMPMQHNESGRFESGFISVTVPNNASVMLGNLVGSTLGIWVAHGEGKFNLPGTEQDHHIALKYSYSGYPANPNGSAWDVAGVCSADGRHLAMMPHLERAIFPWQCGYYPVEHKQDEVTPWIQAFVNARKWVETKKKQQ